MFSIAYTYHLTISIADFTTTFKNTLKASSKSEIIYFPPNYISWVKFRFPTIFIEPATNGHYIMEICCKIQGTNTTGRQRKTILQLVLSYLGFVKHIRDYEIYILKPKSNKYVLIVEFFTDDFLCA